MPNFSHIRKRKKCVPYNFGTAIRVVGTTSLPVESEQKHIIPMFVSRSRIWKNLGERISAMGYYEGLIPSMTEQKRPLTMLADLLSRDSVPTSDRLIAEANQIALDDWDRQFNEKHRTENASQKLSFASDDCAIWCC